MAGTQQNPLDRLYDMLGADMRATNAVIIDNMQSDVAMIPQLAGYLIAAGGKRIRPLLTLAATRLYGYEGPRPYALAAAVEFIHTATLLHDDVVDESDERRGKKPANMVFGNQASILVGDFLFSRAFQLMVRDGSLDVLRILSDAAAIITQGEVMQLSVAGQLQTSMDDYLQVIRGKTASLFAASCEVGPVIAGAGEKAAAAMSSYGMNLGIAFQFADDILDYNADEAELGKRVGDDFREGKMTAPVILALQEADDAERAFWQRTFADRDLREGDLEQAREIIIRRGALERGMAYAREYAQKARDALENTPDDALRAIMADIATYTVERRA